MPEAMEAIHRWSDLVETGRQLRLNHSAELTQQSRLRDMGMLLACALIQSIRHRRVCNIFARNVTFFHREGLARRNQWDWTLLHSLHRIGANAPLFVIA